MLLTARPTGSYVPWGKDRQGFYWVGEREFPCSPGVIKASCFFKITT